MPTIGPLNRRISAIDNDRRNYHQQAKQDIEARRAMHNSQLKTYEQESKSLKRKAWAASMKENLSKIGQSVGKMGPN